MEADGYSPVPDTKLSNRCLTCNHPTDYQYICAQCSDEFLIELFTECRAHGLQP
jgi:hypothetical protein